MFYTIRFPLHIFQIETSGILYIQIDGIKQIKLAIG
jgi:hypothetical protein